MDVNEIDEFCKLWNDIAKGRAVEYATADINRFCEEYNMHQRRVNMKSENEVKRGGYIIGSVNAAGEISFNSKPRVHLDKAAAEAEAERLARSFLDKEFLLVKIEGRVKVDAVQWK